jgi:hypothetical protein
VKDIFKGFTLAFVAIFLVFSVQDRSGASINEVRQSLKKDTVSSKATSEVQIKNKIAVSKSNTKAIKQPAKTISSTKVQPSEFKASINNIFKKSATAKDLFFKKFFSKYLKNPPVIKIDTSSQSFKTLDAQFKKNQSQRPSAQKPLRIDQKTPAPWIKPITDFPGFEANPNDTLEIEGVKDVNDIYNNSDFFLTGTYAEVIVKINTFESMLPSFCETYSKYPYICAMMKFYYAEIRTWIFSYPRDGVYQDGYKFQELYTQIDETYSKETGSKEELFKKLSEVCKERKTYIENDINVEIGKKIIQNEANIKTCLDLIEKLKKNKNVYDVVYNQNGTEVLFFRIGNLKLESFSATVYSSVWDYYCQLIKDYCAIRKFDEADKALNALNLFLSNEVSTIVTSKPFNRDANGVDHPAPQGETQTKIYMPTKTYMDMLKKYMDWNSQYGEIAENGESFQTKVAEIINKVNSYKFDENKDNISLQELEEIKTRFPNKSYDENDNYYSNKALLTQLYFANGENIKLQHNMIKNPLSTITLRGEVDNLNVPVYSIIVDVASVVSKRRKFIVLKKDIISGQYVRSFSINETETPDAPPIPPPNIPEPPPQGPVISFNTIKKIRINPTEYIYDLFFGETKFAYIPEHYVIHKNIISNNKDLKPSIAVFDSEIFDGNLFDIYDLCTYFYSNNKNHNILGYSMKFDEANKVLLNKLGADGKRKINSNDQIINHLTKEFLKAGGGEYIIAIKQGKDQNLTVTTTPQLCKHQANWFVVDAHGDPDTGNIGSSEDNFYLPISELFDKDGKSLYGENMDTLVLLTCNSLNYYKYKVAYDADPNAKNLIFANGWYNVLPSGTILGYRHKFFSKCSLEAIRKLNEFLVANKKATPEDICIEWINIHASLYKEYNKDKEGKKDYHGAQYATYILKKEWVSPRVDPQNPFRSSKTNHDLSSNSLFTFRDMETHSFK